MSCTLIVVLQSTCLRERRAGSAPRPHASGEQHSSQAEILDKFRGESGAPAAATHEDMRLARALSGTRPSASSDPGKQPVCRKPSACAWLSCPVSRKLKVSRASAWREGESVRMTAHSREPSLRHAISAWPACPAPS